MQREKAPDFCLPTLDSEETICLKDLYGKAILLTFWVTWCPACQSELPKKDIFSRSLDIHHFAFYSINVTGREMDPKQVKPYMEQHGYQFPVLLDQGRATYDAYQITSVPTSVLIDPKGTIVNRYPETTPFAEVIKDIGRVLS
ncbi:TlpA disulfide reductase family protein [Melghirimyces algeriensis]|uniref:Peroxiredoxin n=1 Tax=Melghirimyces algeriensis TaxID=910412 RepID=A0A521DG53_9BACL|nr:TlpA disulfide reductase family protein [Melghirimyces algeriensis]SMO70575.1 Peroxiredoxin [Melghirimyces algeriensis]